MPPSASVRPRYSDDGNDDDNDDDDNNNDNDAFGSCIILVQMPGVTRY